MNSQSHKSVMSEQAASSETEDKRKGGAKGSGADGQADARLQEDINLALQIPLPDRDSFWALQDSGIMRGRRSILNIFKKKEMSEDELSTLRQEAEVAPGRARVKIQMLTRKYAENTSLMMLSALCTFRMIKNSTNQKQSLEGLRAATKDAAYVLINDGISLFNVETFFLIYFELLAKSKRFQINVYKTVREGVSHRGSKAPLSIALKITDSLLDEKNRATKVLSQIKGKFKSSSYTTPWGFLDIQTAGKKVEESDFKAICGPAEARETLIYSLALTDLFARIPILTPLVETILKLIPETTTSIILRKNSIQTTRLFSQLNIAIQEENMEKKRSLGRHIFKSASEDLHRIANQPIKQSFEADPYFFLSRVTLLTFGSYGADEQKVMLLASLKAMKNAAKLDITKNHIFTDSAQTMTKKITNLLSDGSE